MINIYQSNKIDILIDFILKTKKKKLFEKKIIIVQNKDIAEWFQIKIAEKTGISANFSFQQPIEFLINLFNNKNSPNIKQHAKETQISWFILKIILDSLNKNEFKMLKNYIDKEKKIEKINKLSEHISKLFKEYLMYKPEWINIWEENKKIKNLNNHQIWQKKIWILLINELKKNNFNKFYIPQILKKITNLKNIFYNKKIPKKIIIYGINYFPIFYFKIINKIQKYINIDIIHLNLFKNLKLNYFNKINLNNKKNKNTPLNIKNNNKNITKFFFEKTIKKNTLIFLKLKKINKITNLFKNFKKNSLLNNLKQEILNFKKNEKINYKIKPPKKNSKKIKINKSDISLTFHSCNTKQTEIEVLYDYLLNLIKKDNKITPKDIIVMAPNISLYTSYINGVFGSIPKKKRLPFQILDQNLINNNSTINAFIYLIKINKKKITTEKIFKLLEISELSEKFCIKNNQINLLKKWIHESGIRLNINNFNESKNKKYMMQNTWSYGLNRIILGHIMNNKHETWNNILPYNQQEILSFKLIEKFLEFIKLIKKWNKILTKKKKITEWIPICKKLLNNFFCFNIKNQLILIFIIKKWKEMLNDGEKTKIKNKIPISVIYDKIKKYFKKKNENEKFFSNNINFCSINKKRNIPFKIICLIGMNHSFYSNNELEFNLIKKNKNEKNIKYQNQYFFLENLILASNFYYISYIKNNIYDNYEKYPYIITEEIINYINHKFYIKKNNISNTKKNIRDIKKHIIKKHQYTFIKKNIFYLNKNKKYYTKEEKQKKKKYLCITPIKQNKKKTNIIKLNELLFFYKNPIKYFFNKKLKTNFSINNRKILNKEIFELDKLDQLKFNKILLKLIIKKKTKKQIIKLFMSTGLFPIRNFGKIYIEEQIKNITPLTKKIKKILKKKINKSFSLKFNKTIIKGRLIKINSNSIIRYKPSILTINDGFSLWIEHLIFCSCFKPCTSYYLGIKNSEWYFKKIDSKEAKKYLKKIIIEYKKGINFPLILFQKSGWKWLNCFYNKKNKEFDFKSKEKIKKAKKKIIQSLKGTLNQKGELNDIYNMKIFNSLNKKLIKKIQKNTIKYLLPMIKFAKYKKIKN